VLGVLLGLVLVEQRHDLPDHIAHRIVAKLLGDGDELDAGLGEPADVEFKLELVAEEAAEAVHDNRVEGRRLGRSGVDHALELRPPVVGRRHAGLDIIGHDLPAAFLTVAFGLATLVGNGEVTVGLSAGRDSQIEGNANRRDHRSIPEAQWRVENNSSNRSPNQASNTSISASVTGNSSGQSSDTVQVLGSSARGRPGRRAYGRA